jgi:1,4-dihydroxy-2-naphthoate octaprenyltransferase
MVNISMWGKALRVIPRISKKEWVRLDLVSKWLVASRAAVFVMTALAAAIGGLLAFRYGSFSWDLFIMSILGLVFAHATNNMLNDYVDHRQGIDHKNYYRAQYGPQPLEHGLMTRRELLYYILVTGMIALFIGIYLILRTNLTTLWFLAAGLFFLLFYTWPLKYFGLGEPSVILVWGPLMIGGTFFVVSGGEWQNWIIPLSLVYALGPTSVLFGKHIDKRNNDRYKGVKTLPVIIGERASRLTTIGMWIAQYLLVLWLVFTGQLGLILLIVFLAIPKFIRATKIFSKPRPEKEPEGLAPETWPLYLVSYAFDYNKRFGSLFLLGLILDIILYKSHLPTTLF